MANWVGTPQNANEGSCSEWGSQPCPRFRAQGEGKPCGVRQDRTLATLGHVIWAKPGPHSELQLLPMGFRSMTQKRDVQGLGWGLRMMCADSFIPWAEISGFVIVLQEKGIKFTNICLCMPPFP